MKVTNYNEMKTNLPSSYTSNKSDQIMKGEITRTGMKRATFWNIDIENIFRLQQVGWKDIHEYASIYPNPSTWTTNGLYSEIRVKENGFYTYWRKYRECPESYLNKVKIYSY